MENPFVKLAKENFGEMPITEDLERQLGEAETKLETAESDEMRKEIEKEIEDLKKAIEGTKF